MYYTCVLVLAMVVLKEKGGHGLDDIQLINYVDIPLAMALTYASYIV